MLKQRRLPYIGAFKDILSHTVFWMAPINFTLIAITAYWTTIKPWLFTYVPWIQWWIFLGLLGTVVGIMMVVEYKFIMPNYYSFRQRQYNQDNELKQLLEEVLKKMRCK